MTQVLVLAATHSGTGKTLLTSALARAFQRRGLVVATAKCGPDHIDPRFHERVTGRPSYNLDSWSLAPESLQNLAERAGEGADLLLIEGVMGLFDGAGSAGISGRGATADLAKTLGAPVILLLNASGTAQSLGATALGFCQYDPALDLAGLIVNRAASPRHESLIASGLSGAKLPPLIGSLPPDSKATLARRHLGLIQAEELEDLDEILNGFADLIEKRLDLDLLLEIAKPLRVGKKRQPLALLPPLGQRIAIARDKAFSFCYPHLATSWREAGAELIPFSPLADEAPDERAEAIYLPGGYPELYLPELSAGRRWQTAIRCAVDRGVWTYGECGGYMVMGEAIRGETDQSFPMLGLLPLETSFSKARRKLHLGYRRVKGLADTPLGNRGAAFRAHEFHYAATLSKAGEPLFALEGDSSGTDEVESGLRKGRCFGSFFHLIAAE